METITALIRDIPDFPRPGVMFKDLTPLLRDAPAMALCTEQLTAPFRDDGITAVLGMEARGFVFGALVASALGAGFVPLRKPGKLPAATRSVDYELEYGSASLHMHHDALTGADRVLLVDDLIATGGDAVALTDAGHFALHGDVAVAAQSGAACRVSATDLDIEVRAVHASDGDVGIELDHAQSRVSG